MLGEHVVERAVHDRKVRRRKVPLAPNGGISGCEHQCVLLTQRKLHCCGQPQDHLAARLSSARLDKAQVPLRGAGGEREIKLRKAAPAAPVFQEPTERAPV
jgi:hypothetical protein